MYKIIRASRLYEQIVQQVEESIHKGALKPGDQLPPERELAEQFGVSRTAVREAVKTLREKGLVEAYPGRGTFITDGSSNTIRQSLHRMMRSGNEGFAFLAEVREILEPEIAALATTRADKEVLAAMKEQVEVMDARGQWVKVADQPEELALAVPPWLRRAATHELHIRGVDYLMMQDGEAGANDLADDPDAWGVVAMARTRQSTLYKITPEKTTP